MFNCYKREKKKGHVQVDVTSNKKSGTSRLFTCPTIILATTSKYSYNIVKHLRSCHKVNQNKKDANGKKICSYCNKVFAKKANGDQNVKPYISANIKKEVAVDLGDLQAFDDGNVEVDREH